MTCGVIAKLKKYLLLIVSTLENATVPSSLYCGLKALKTLCIGLQFAQFTLQHNSFGRCVTLLSVSLTILKTFAISWRLHSNIADFFCNVNSSHLRCLLIVVSQGFSRRYTTPQFCTMFQTLRAGELQFIFAACEGRYHADLDLLRGLLLFLVLAVNEPRESWAVSLVEKRVDKGINTRRDVAHPDEDAEELFNQFFITNVYTDDGHYVGHKKRTPHHNE